MIGDPAVRRVALALIRAGNASVISPTDPDNLLLSMYGDGALPLAQAIVDVIRDEVRAAR